MEFLIERDVIVVEFRRDSFTFLLQSEIGFILWLNFR